METIPPVFCPAAALSLAPIEFSNTALKDINIWTLMM